MPYGNLQQIDVDSTSQNRINFNFCHIIGNIMSHFLDIHYSDNCSAVTDSTKYPIKITVAFVKTVFKSNTYALPN